jgi:endonuclease/exonuclease/phosphatase family metal-dependent hydrolase
LHWILRQWQSKYPDAPSMLMGDMNHPKSDVPVYAGLCGRPGPGVAPGTRLLDTFDYRARPKGALWGTWQQFKGKPVIALPSDLIFVSPAWRYTPARILRDHTRAGLYPSDHYFVISELTWPGGGTASPSK